jgi:hypothetical protein
LRPISKLSYLFNIAQLSLAKTSIVVQFDGSFKSETMVEIVGIHEIMDGTVLRYSVDSEHLVRYVFQILCDRVKQSPESYSMVKPL